MSGLNMNLHGIILFSQPFFSSQWRVTGKVWKEGCYAAEVVNRFINFGVINLYYVPFREAAESKKPSCSLWQHILLSLQGCTFLHSTHFWPISSILIFIFILFFTMFAIIIKLHSCNVKPNCLAAVVKEIPVVFYLSLLYTLIIFSFCIICQST